MPISLPPVVSNPRGSKSAAAVMKAVPETSGVGEIGVALGEELLELVRLEEVADGLVAAEPAAAALPPLVADLLAARHRRSGQQKQQQCRPSRPRHRCLGWSLSSQTNQLNTVWRGEPRIRWNRGARKKTVVEDERRLETVATVVDAEGDGELSLRHPVTD